MWNILLADSTTKTMLFVLIGVLLAFIVLLVILGTVFIVSLRKRAPVVKVVMAPSLEEEKPEEREQLEQQEETMQEVAEEPEEAEVEQVELTEEVGAEPEPVTESKKREEEIVVALPETAEEEDNDSEADESDVEYVEEGGVHVRYEKSFTAKLTQLKSEVKDWYSLLKNELLSYKKVRSRMSWKRESFRLGRMTVARFVVRGKTLCLLLAVEPAGYAGTKYSVEDVSSVAANADTPCLYRIKNARRAKYAVEIIAGLMKELKVLKDASFAEQNYAMPYEDTAALLEQGLVKRVVTAGNSPFAKIGAVEELPIAQDENKEPNGGNHE